MIRISQTLEPIKSRLYMASDQFKAMVFGINNERLDFVIDSFHKLKPQHQKLVYLTSAFAAALIMILVVTLYVQGVHHLKQQLYDSISAGRELSQLQSKVGLSQQQFRSLINEVASKTQNISSFKNVFENISRDVDVNLVRLDEKVMENPQMELLANQMNEVKVDVDIDNVSLPKFFKFVTQLEKSNTYLSVTHLTIRARYETKLYFDTKVSVRGYLIK